jgi:hypothetical protein
VQPQPGQEDRESRGLHFNVDHPGLLPVARHTVLKPPRG